MKHSLWLLTLGLPLAALGQTKAPAKAPSHPAPAAAPAPAPAKPAPGVSWEGQVVRATGAGAPDMKASSPAQARLGAEKAAQLDAFRNLLAQVRGIQVSAGKTVGDAMSQDEVRGKVEGVLRGFKVTGKRYFSDGGVELDVEVPLAAVTSAVVPTSGEALALNEKGEPRNTGLVVDARGLGAKPVLAPRLVDASGKALYGPAALGAEARGVAAWAASLEAAKKSALVGEHPLTVKATRLEGSDLVLSAEDAGKLASANNSFLAEGRVVIVTQ
ncbi:hypothetical protein FGE12_00150 [Aggregicoccus sp. 17bor-14]|uniref:LPP20 family lipoprotein n=1 Tax=Myxococcaceae TaxID=31 RepID=UPI0012EF7F52|nr:hypothetical protein [Simulacricoccus sp. 17bor-14]MRI86575.1 hypothetical protein [Aggregicoccus sp. 17bor-14]